MNSRFYSFLLAVGFLTCAGHLASQSAPELSGEWRSQFTRLEQEMKERDWCDRVAGQTEHPAALLTAGDRDPLDVVLRRSEALLAHLAGQPDAPDLAAERNQLTALAAKSATVDITLKNERYALYEQACHLRRAIAFRNPLLDFERILFLTKHRPMRGDPHMVDQYYGFNARPGGGIQILENPFSDHQESRDLLAGRTISNGRLAGRALDGGAFNTLELDYDGKEILFAWSECGPVPADADWSNQPWSAERAAQNKKPFYYWHPQTTFHVFKTSLDGKEVTQLTDGPWNEFDPCFLPNGRIAFVSERRGGYLRCGGNRPNPNYTLHAMMRNGSDIIPLSFHETNEWNPSINHNGMIAYTRWDYVDRDNDTAHHLWLCHPDGRDPRSYHANYPVVRESRPWMELSIRSIPGSRRYVAVAAPHHGYNYGSLVLIDQSSDDDNAMSQTTRLTPEVHFPESESAPGSPLPKGTHRPNGEVYGSPWPLSEKFHLCVYDSDKRQYGIYLIDCFGNKELLWRDPAIACLDPIPLRPRSRPQIIPSATCQAKVDQLPNGDKSGTIAIQNVYASDFKWPEGTRIEAIRVVQLFPKSTFHMNEPMVGAGVESLTRGVVGTAPVAADGSAHFKVPTGVPIYFQALDGDGLAVQSMRSATYVHPGERLSCVGCHEPKQQAPSHSSGAPLALRKAPAILQPESPDASPISFPRLVQPVIEKHCTSCHSEPDSIKVGAPNLSGKLTGPNGWSAAFTALKPYAWAHNGGNGIISKEGARSEAGKIGARASRLLPYLNPAHYKVRLNPEEMRRITLWLDCNSNFYGAYHDLQAQGEGLNIAPEVQ
jgi:hypothetical protein